MFATGFIRSVCAGLSCFFVSKAFGADTLYLQRDSLVMVNTLFHIDTSGSQTSTMLKRSDNLVLVKSRVDANQVTHLRMQQEYEGFPVFGGYAIIHSKAGANRHLSSNGPATVNGTLFKGLQDELGKPTPAFQTAANSALKKFLMPYQTYRTSQEQVKPIIYINSAGKALWAYEVSVFVEYDDKIPERPTAILDAITFRPYRVWDEVKTSHSQVPGVGFSGNLATQKQQFGKELPLLLIKRDPKCSVCYMENNHTKVIDMGNEYRDISRTMQFACKAPDPALSNGFWTGYFADGYDAANGAYSPANDVLYAGQVINDMYQNWYGVDPLAKHGKSKQLIMRVHYGVGYDNAFWDGHQLTFGDGDSRIHPPVSLGISAHEISHGFTEQHAALVYFGQSGAMNEAFSDMAAQAAEFYAHKHSSWAIGGDVMKKDNPTQAIRYLDKPDRDGHSISLAGEYADDLDVHYASGVYNHLFYTLANKPDWDTRKAFHVMVKANMDYWTPYSSFEEGGCGIISAAADLGFSTSDVEQALDTVGISYARCSSSSLTTEKGV